MKLYLKFDPKIALKKIIKEQFDKFHVEFEYQGFAEMEISDSVPGSQLNEISTQLNDYGIGIIENRQSILVQKIKDTIIEIVQMDDKLPTTNSVYLSEKLNLRYDHMTTLFSEVTLTSIEYFTLLQKIERAKQLITTNELTFSEIAYRLNYSSAAHFSNQFKRVTGLTPSAFQRIIKRRREYSSQSKLINSD
jgi:AraC-like DNA-binding protein